MSPQFLRFCLVGGVGFIVDFLVLQALIIFGFTPQFARIYSILLALQVTFVLHRQFTFRVQHSWWRAWIKFMASNALGALVNYACFVFALNFVSHTPAMLIATVIALFFNYWANKRYVFRPKK